MSNAEYKVLQMEFSNPSNNRHAKSERKICGGIVELNLTDFKGKGENAGEKPS
jgi:hypothetical protein